LTVPLLRLKRTLRKDSEMTDIKSKVGYIRGLMDGLKLNRDDDIVKVMAAVTEALDDMAQEVQLLRDQYTELNEYVEQIDDDLAELEMDVSDSDEDNIIDDDWSAQYFDKSEDTDDDDDDE